MFFSQGGEATSFPGLFPFGGGGKSFWCQSLVPPKGKSPWNEVGEGGGGPDRRLGKSLIFRVDCLEFCEDLTEGCVLSSTNIKDLRDLPDSVFASGEFTRANCKRALPTFFTVLVGVEMVLIDPHTNSYR